MRAVLSSELPSDDTNVGNNAFECLTCPYQKFIHKGYEDDMKMEIKTVEDVLGGADSWKNVDRTESGSCHLSNTVDHANFQVNCTSEKCDNREAYYRQVQIRSADEPMTTFYRVLFRIISAMRPFIDMDSAPNATETGEKIDHDSCYPYKSCGTNHGRLITLLNHSLNQSRHDHVCSELLLLQQLECL